MDVVSQPTVALSALLTLPFLLDVQSPASSDLGPVVSEASLLGGARESATSRSLCAGDRQLPVHVIRSLHIELMFFGSYVVLEKRAVRSQVLGCFPHHIVSEGGEQLIQGLVGWKTANLVSMGTSLADLTRGKASKGFTSAPLVKFRRCRR